MHKDRSLITNLSWIWLFASISPDLQAGVLSEPVNLQIWVDIDIIEKRVMYDEHTLFWRTSNMFDILSQF